MNEIPMWWLIASGVFFVLVAVFFLALCVMVGTLIKLVKNMEPKVSSLLTQVQGLVQKVESLTAKVEGIADSTKTTVDSVGGRAKSIAGTVEHVTAIAGKGFERFAPILGTVLAAVRLFGLYQDMRAKAATTKTAEEKAAGADATNGHSSGNVDSKQGKLMPRRGVEQSGSSSGS
jgi:outer membrane murein-binding lipoprotein Lpp